MKKALSILLVIVMLVSFAPSSFAFDPTNYGAAESIEVGTIVQDEYSGGIKDKWYKFVATEDQYYEIKLRNQSIEFRTNIYADNLLDSLFLGNYFNGRLQVLIRDQYGDDMAKGFVKCGYEGSVYLRLNKGETYYIGLSSEYSGNFRLLVTKLNDIGGQTTEEATQVTSTSQVISMVDVPDDVDWYMFETDDYHSFYEFSVENVSCNSYLYFYLYEYVEGAGLRSLMNFSVSSSRTVIENIELKDNGKYYYYISSSGGTGGYIVDVAQMYDEVSGEKFSAYPVDRDTKITSSFDGDNDVDYYKFTTADYDAYYHIYMDNLSEINFSMSLYDEFGNALMSDNIYYDDFSDNKKLEKNTTYYLYFKGAKRGNYEFSITTIADTVPNEKENAQSIDCDTTITTSFDGNNDVDYYKFTTADYDAYYHIYMDNLSEINFSMSLYDESGNALMSGNINYDDFSDNKKLEKNTTYYLYFKGAKRGNYEFSITTIADTVPNEKENAQSIDCDTTITTSFDGNNDVDYYKFTTADYDAYYHIYMDNLSEINFSMSLYDESGNALMSGNINYDDFSDNKKLEKNTTYYLYFKGAKRGNYEFSITTVADTVPNEKENAQSIDCDTTITTSFDGNNDVDYYKFTTADYDAYYHIYMDNLSEINFSMSLYDEFGNALMSGNINYDDFSDNKKLEKNTTYYLYFKGAKRGNYEFSITTIADPEGDDKPLASEIGFNTKHESDLASSDDEDWYKFTVTDFMNCRIRLVVESGRNKKLEIYSSRDTLMLYLDGTTNRTINLEEGTYYMCVYGDAGYYTVAVADCGNGHDWVLKRVITPATCKDKGQELYYCSCCYAEVTENTEKLTTHTYEWIVTKEATTESAGSRYQKCTVCAAKGITEEIPKLKPHTYEWIVTLEPTEDAPGSRYQKCTDCGAIGITEEIPRLTGADTLGDIDGNGKINAADARLALRIAARIDVPTDAQKIAADYDKNGTVNASDARLILRKAAMLD